MMPSGRSVASIFRGDIGSSWARAEERLGEYWRIRSVTEVLHGWEAVATDGNRIRIGNGPTVSAALDDLSAVGSAVGPSDPES
jgi:hypothetical protein